ncbi:MAG: hypothetical protein JNL96_24955 [Planctomycetaceae bacterium]|nr:hypothetical protein [Planctomycetaceae bacterium]
MLRFMKFVAASLVLATAADASAAAYTYTDTMAHANRRSAVVYRAPARMAAPMVAAAPSDVTGTRSMSVEPGTAPTVRYYYYGHPNAYRAAHGNTPTWLLPKSDPHRFVTGY